MDGNTKVCDITWKKLQELLNSIPALLHSVAGVGIASIILEKGGQQKVVALGTGNTCYNQSFNKQFPYDGLSLFDGHSISIARRAMKAYLFEELFRFHSGLEDSIFTSVHSQINRLQLKESVKFHVFLSQPPDTWPKIKRCDEGKKLLVHSDGGDTVMATDSYIEHLKLYPEGTTNNITMTSGSKIAQWSVTGWQGALLSHFIQPIYMSSFIIGHSENDVASDTLPLNSIFKNISSYDLPEIFSYHNILCNFVKTKMPPERIPFETKTLCVNWYMGQTDAEIVNTINGESRLCKAVLFKLFRRLAEKAEMFQLLQNLNYGDTKVSSQDYVKCKSAVHHFMQMDGCGLWIKRNGVDNFHA